MITYKPIIIPNNRRKDGSYPVKIRVYFKGKARRLPTTLVCRQADLTRSLKIKNPDILKNAEEVIRRMRSVTDSLAFYELEDKDVDWVVNRIKDGFLSERFSLDFFQWSERYLKTKNLSTRKAYERALNALERFLGERQLDINDISKMMLLDFMEFVDNEPKMHYSHSTGRWSRTGKEKVARASSSLHLMKLQHIFNAAKDRFNDEDSDQIRIPRSPFSSIRKVFPSGGQGQKALSRETMQMLIDAQTDDPQVRVALDAFVVSFALMGANLADLYNAIPFNGDVWEYNRQKTAERRDDGALMRVTIPEQIRNHLLRLRGDGGWWLSELHRIGTKRHICNAKLNESLRRWQKNAGIEDFTFYAARHTWATIARKLGHDLALINDCLCHKDNLQIARVYAEVDWEQINEVNRSVIGSFRW